MTLEALRTKLDSLVWENSQLEIENKRLRESNPGQAAMVDLEAELERTEEDTVHLTEQLGGLEKELSAALQREDDLRQRVEAAEGQPKPIQPAEQMVRELETRPIKTRRWKKPEQLRVKTKRRNLHNR